MALAIVVPESVTRYMDEELNLKKMKHQPITVSSDKSIGDAGRATATASAKATALQLAPKQRHGQGRATLAPAHSSSFLSDCNRSIARI